MPHRVEGRRPRLTYLVIGAGYLAVTLQLPALLQLSLVEARGIAAPCSRRTCACQATGGCAMRCCHPTAAETDPGKEGTKARTRLAEAPCRGAPASGGARIAKPPHMVLPPERAHGGDLPWRAWLSAPPVSPCALSPEPSVPVPI